MIVVQTTSSVQIMLEDNLQFKFKRRAMDDFQSVLPIIEYFRLIRVIARSNNKITNNMR